MAPKNSNIKDVARRAGVSIATVSYVLNNTKKVSEETRRRVLKAAEGLQYQPNPQARSLRLNQGREIFVLVEEACLANMVAVPLMTGLVTALQQRYSHITTRFFRAPQQAVTQLRQQDFYAAYILSGNSMKQYWSACGDGVLFLNLNLEDCAPASGEHGQLDLGVFFYRELEDQLRRGGVSQVVMNYRQGSVFKRLAENSNFENIRLMGSEFSSGAFYLQEALNRGGGRILFADYTLFAGAAKYLLQHEELLYSRDVEIEYLPWAHPAETYGLPLTIRALPVEEMLQYILEQSLSA